MSLSLMLANQPDRIRRRLPAVVRELRWLAEGRDRLFGAHWLDPRRRQALGTLARVRVALGTRPIDVLFIGGDHSYAGVQADHELHAPLVRPGGLIAFHDIVPDHRMRHGRDTGRYAGDVPRYWSDVRGRFAEVREFVPDPGQDGLDIGVGIACVP